MTENNEQNLLKYIQTEDVFQKVKLLNGQSIGIIPWKVKQENQLLFSIETNGDDKSYIVDQCIILARKCVDNVELFDTLSRNVLLDLITKIRKFSKGETIEITYKCNNPECSTFHKYSPEVAKLKGKLGESTMELDGMIDLNEDISTKMFDDSPLDLPKFVFHFKEAPYLVQKELEEKLLYGEKIKINEFNYKLLLASVSKIEIKKADNNEVISEFSKDELSAFIDNLSSTDYKKLLGGFVDKISTFELKKEVSCPSCNQSQEIMYDNIFSLLVF